MYDLRDGNFLEVLTHVRFIEILCGNYFETGMVYLSLIKLIYIYIYTFIIVNYKYDIRKIHVIIIHHNFYNFCIKI